MRDTQAFIPSKSTALEAAPPSASWQRGRTVAQARWDDARANSETKALYGNAVGFAEEFLRVVRGTFMQKKDSPAESARTAWESDDRAAFDAVVAKWVALFPRR